MNFRARKKTKIVATISDRKCSVEFLRELYQNGMNVVRLNTAHQTPEQSMKVVENVRAVSPKIALMIDTKGPEVRTLERENTLFVVEDQEVKFFSNSKLASPESVVVSYGPFVDEVPVGQPILIDDGALQFDVIGKHDEYLLCKAKNDGQVASRKSVNTPNLSLKQPALTAKDILYVEWAADNDIDFIAHSFVRHKKDLLAIHKILVKKKARCKIISKIENQEGVDNIESILDHCYGVMIARGDLAVEIPRQKIPVIQKRLVRLCIKRRKPVIVATQMLHTMMENPTPTRAEVSDVANAIFDGVDAIMLSGETAYGKYPIEAMKVMNEIALEVEKNVPTYLHEEAMILNTKVSAYLCKSAVETANELDAQAIISDTVSGRTVRNMAGFRGEQPLIALCYVPQTMRELALSYGVFTYGLDQRRRSTDEFLEVAVNRIAEKYSLEDSDLLVVLTGNYGTTVGASFMKVASIGNLRNRIS